ncbi:MAG: restriction endonuclease subunit S [Oscillospiraceae bacterium]
MRKMKDSGIPWIGEIPADWMLSKVSRFYKIQLGKMLQPTKKADDDTFEQYLCAANVGQNQLKTDAMKQMWFSPQEKELYKIYPGDLLVVEGGDVASSDIVSDDLGEVYFQNSLHCVRPISDYDVRFLRFWLIAAKACGYIDLICNKATIAHFSKEKFSALPFPSISIKEQINIIDALDSQCAEIDAVLDKTRTSIEEYKKLKQAIITQAVTKGIRGDRPMKESGIEWIGAIPENWDVRRIKSIGTYRNGLTYAPGDQTDEMGTFVLRSSNVQNGKLDFSNNVFVSCEIPAQLMVQKGDILICSRNGSRELIGKSAIIDSDICASFGAFMMIFRCECPRYMYYLLNSNIFSVYLNTFLTTTINQLTGKNFGNMNVVYCPNAVEQDEIVSFLDRRCLELDELIIKKKRLINALESYKKSLIYEYVTGKKEVSNAT